MPTQVEELIKVINTGNLDFAHLRELLQHRTDTVRANAIWAMAKLVESSPSERAAAIDQLRVFALTPENQQVHHFGPPLSYLAVEALLRIDEDPALRAAHEVCAVLAGVERSELETYLASRGVSL